MSIGAVVEALAERVALGRTPADFEVRLNVLRKRGLSDRLIADLWHGSDWEMLATVEALSATDISRLNLTSVQK